MILKLKVKLRRNM